MKTNLQTHISSNSICCVPSLKKIANGFIALINLFLSCLCCIPKIPYFKIESRISTKQNIKNDNINITTNDIIIISKNTLNEINNIENKNEIKENIVEENKNSINKEIVNENDKENIIEEEKKDNSTTKENINKYSENIEKLSDKDFPLKLHSKSVSDTESIIEFIIPDKNAPTKITLKHPKDSTELVLILKLHNESPKARWSIIYSYLQALEFAGVIPHQMTQNKYEEKSMEICWKMSEKNELNDSFLNEIKNIIQFSKTDEEYPKNSKVIENDIVSSKMGKWFLYYNQPTFHSVRINAHIGWTLLFIEKYLDSEAPQKKIKNYGLSDNHEIIKNELDELYLYTIVKNEKYNTYRNTLKYIQEIDEATRLLKPSIDDDTLFNILMRFVKKKVDNKKYFLLLNYLLYKNKNDENKTYSIAFKMLKKWQNRIDSAEWGALIGAYLSLINYDYINPKLDQKLQRSILDSALKFLKEIDKNKFEQMERQTHSALCTYFITIMNNLIVTRENIDKIDQYKDLLSKCLYCSDLYKKKFNALLDDKSEIRINMLKFLYQTTVSR